MNYTVFCQVQVFKSNETGKTIQLAVVGSNFKHHVNKGIGYNNDMKSSEKSHSKMIRCEGKTIVQHCENET